MNLPDHYFPVRVCPHIEEGDHFRLMFADYGSYENVNLIVNDEEDRFTFLPQKEHESMKNLARNTPSLPLFSCPLNDKCNEWDHILGMQNYNEMLNDLKYLTNRLHNKRGILKNASQEKFAKRFHACSKTIQDVYHNGRNDVVQPPVMNSSNLVQMLDKGIHLIYTKYEKAFDACARKTSSLKGYNRDYYGGLLSVAQANNSTSSHSLIHAGGDSFQDIFLTETSCKPGSRRLRNVKLLDKISPGEPVFQIISSNICIDEGLICARHKHKSVLISNSGADGKLVQIDYTDITDSVLTSVEFSPYMTNEILISTDNGCVYLWDISSSSKNLLLMKAQNSNCQDKWSCSYFGGHPRHVVAANNTSVAMYDHRSHFSNGIELFALSPSLTKEEEHVMAVTSLGFPFHAIVTNYAIFIIDQRFGLAPVFQWSTEFISSPQYIQVLHPQNMHTEHEKILIIASQQPPEVMCFPINLQGGCSPTSSVLPWKISQIGDCYQSRHTSYTSDLSKVDKRFETSLAGVAAFYQSSQDSCTFYQMDGYGDIFYQSLIHNHGESLYNLQACSEDEKLAADKHIENWLKNFESSISTGTSELQCSSINLAPKILRDIFKQEDKEVNIKLKPISSASQNTSLHRNLKALEKLPSKGSSSRLHLALRENKNILDFVQKREDDHTAMKKTIRRKNLKIIRRKKSRRKTQSKFSSENDDSDSWQTASVVTIRSTNSQTRCDEISLSGLLKVEVETSSNSTINSKDETTSQTIDCIDESSSSSHSLP